MIIHQGGRGVNPFKAHRSLSFLYSLKGVREVGADGDKILPSYFKLFEPICPREAS